MKMQTLLAATILSSIALTACAGSGYGSNSSDSYDSYDASKTVTIAQADTVVMKVNTSLGEVFATSKGLTLYTFTKDVPGKSNCDGGCAANWPPFTAKKSAKTWGEFTIIERSDGTYQWAYQNQPLYTWVGDKKEGDINGHGVGNVWYAAQVSK